MYSPRRYYRKKYYSNYSIYHPNIKLNHRITRNQRKGMIIQRDSNIPQRASTTFTVKDLEKQAEKLMNMGFIPIQLPPDYSAYITSLTYSNSVTSILNSAGSLTYTFDQEWLGDYIQTKMSTLPDIPNDTHWVFSLTNIYFDRKGFGSTDASRWNLTFTSPQFLTSGSYNIVNKTADTGPYTNGVKTPIFISRINTNNACKITTVSYNDYTVTTSDVTVSTKDSNVNDNGYYPFITNDNNALTNDGTITLTETVGGGVLDATYLVFNIILFVEHN